MESMMEALQAAMEATELCLALFGIAGGPLFETALTNGSLPCMNASTAGFGCESGG